MIKNNMLEKINDIEKACYAENKEEVLKEMQLFINEIDSINVDIYKLNILMNKIATALENDNYILLSDYLEFGMKALLDSKEISEEILNIDFDIIPDVNENIFYMNSLFDELTLCVKHDKSKIIYVNSPFSPVHETEYIISELNIKENTPAICLFGIGTGLQADILLKKLSEDGKMMIYEPDNRLIEYCKQCGNDPESSISEKNVWKRINRIISDKRVVLYIANEDNRPFHELLSIHVDYKGLTGLVFSFEPGYRKLFSQECLDYIREIDYYRTVTCANRSTLYFFSNHYLDYIFKNLFVCKKINTCEDIGKVLPKDIPVIIVAAGPSLNKNVEKLRVLKGHSLIIAVDTAVRTLLARDIIPDLLITIDPIKPSVYFEDERSHDIPCIFDINANPDIVSRHKGRVFISICNEYLESLLKSVGKDIKTEQCGGGSVATAAFVKMHDLKQKKIILIGQDLASENGKTHADGESDGAGLGDIVVEGINGDKVYSRRDWYSYLKWYEKAMETIKNAGEDMRIIDATEGGAKIAGTEIMTLQEVIEDCKDENGKLPDYDFLKELEKLPYLLNEDEYMLLCKNHKDNISKLKKLISDSEEVLSTCKKLINGINNNNITAQFLDREKKKINKIHEKYKQNPFHAIINNYVLGNIVDVVSNLNEDSDIKKRELNGLELIRITFDTIKSVAEQIRGNTNNYLCLLDK